MIFNDIKTIYTKTGEIADDFSPFLINRFLSFSFKSDIIKLTSEIDRYTFHLPKEMLLKLYMRLIPKQNTEFLQYIKKPKEQEQELEFILKKYKRFYKWSDNEMKQNVGLFIDEFKDKNKLKKAMDIFGVEQKYYKKMNIKTERPKPIKKGLEFFT